MHKLESLDLVGFKSFSDKTSVLLHDRVTCIVGPNGCGKSNVAEAISWVLGEQRPKSLRSDKMEDVIFNGTATRKSSGFVEVSLTLKPAKTPAGLDDGIPVDNITVTRRLYRSGESEYLINSKRCRLLDIHQTFEGTGLGFTNYAVIEQGRIGSILASKPVERRSLIEEAAKIVTFKQKKKAAEVKLELAHQNLLRINDIVVEIERQLRSLKRQAGRAQAFARLREEMRVFHRLKLDHDYGALRSQMERCELEFRGLQQQEQQAADTLGACEEQAHTLGARYHQLALDLEQCREQLSQATLELEKSVQTRQSQEQHIHLTRGQIESLERDIDEWEHRLLDMRRTLQDKSDLRGELDLEVKAIRQRMEEFKTEIRQVQKQIEQLEERLDQVRNYSLDEVGKKATLNNQKSQIQQDLSVLDPRQARTRTDQEKSSGRCSELRSQETHTLERCRETQREIDRQIQHEQQLEKDFHEAVSRESAAEAELQSLRESYGSYQHRLASIEDIEARRTNYSEGVQKFLNFIRQHNSLRSAGTLADHVETEPQYETLVETFLDDELEFVLVDGVPEALNGLQQLRESHAGKCTFLALQSGNGFGHNGNGHPDPDPARGIIGSLGDLLKMDEPVRQAFHRALPQYAHAVVVKDIQCAQNLGQQYPETTFVTLAGETWTQRGVISGIGETSHTSGLLALKREKRELVSRAEALQKEIQNTETEALRLKEERKRLEQMQKDQRNLIHAAEKDLLSLQHQYNQLLSDLQREEQAARVFNNELAQIQFEREQLTKEHSRIEQELKELAQAGVDRDQEFVRIQEKLARLRARGQELGRLLSENQSDLAAKLERKSAADQEWARLTEEEVQLAAKLQRHQEQLSDGQKRIAALENSNQELASSADRLQARKQTLEEELNHKKMSSAQLQQQSQESQRALEEAHRRKESAMEQRMQLEVERARLNSDRDHMRQYCQDEFGLPLDELASSVPQGWEERSYEEIKAEFERLKTRVEDFGPINMSALEEYRENEERFNFLSRQRADIERSIADTQQAIQEINKRSRDQFLEAFEAINTNFKAMFQVLFGGGECGMALMDESDVLESGIDIYAQPPGKRLQNVMLLSGGEKALTAFALLIALFKYRPSPFCVLDEVDAPLDEANIARFTNLIGHMSDVTQFIIITHNKRTMEISQSIYGVTMEEPGVSKVVSVNFN
jgi:chromosome segregation protein